MAAATDFAPEFTPVLPERDWRDAPWDARRDDPRQLADVVPLFAPADTPRLRLTRRGRRAAALLVFGVAGALVWLAAQSAPAAAPNPRVPAAVTVLPGDTLWSIAARVAPGTDPRAEVDALLRLNHLSGPALLPGQVLRTR
jgi:hypothetical protein